MPNKLIIATYNKAHESSCLQFSALHTTTNRLMIVLAYLKILCPPPDSVKPAYNVIVIEPLDIKTNRVINKGKHE